VFKVAEFKGS